MKLSLENLTEIIENNFLKFKNEWLILFGSQLTQHKTSKSDIDIVLVTKEKNYDKNKKIFLDNIYLNQEPFDFKIFELLPLHIQIGIIENYKVIYGNELEISEYFYEFRKKWRDQVKRIRENQITSIDEYNRGIENRKKVIEHQMKFK